MPAAKARRAERAGAAGWPAGSSRRSAASPRLKRTVRELSSRYPAVRKLRIMAWRALERTRTRGNRAQGRS